MERLLRLERFDSDPGVPSASLEWKHLFKTFENFLSALQEEGLDKLGILINFISPKVYETISECNKYTDAISVLKSQYVKVSNEVFARYLLATRRQQDGEILNDYLRSLRVLSRDCNFKAVSAVQHCEESIRDSFFSGLRLPSIRQKLLENKTLALASMFESWRMICEQRTVGLSGKQWDSLQ
ncbi:uncharacterized protein LOC135106827 [Scylla paramamosain]|uniref:uncharacterized protein LOC135106827 n=1 Tax=Scylla paramamosain TaxID=85552 RepID=UPI003082CEC2